MKQWKTKVKEYLREIKKDEFIPFIKSVRYGSGAMTSSIDIYCVGMEYQKYNELVSILNVFKYGSFDGMTDCYNVDNSRDDVDQVKWVCCHHEMTDEQLSFVKEIIVSGQVTDCGKHAYSEKYGIHWMKDVWGSMCEERAVWRKLGEAKEEAVA